MLVILSWAGRVRDDNVHAGFVVVAAAVTRVVASPTSAVIFVAFVVTVV